MFPSPNARRVTQTDPNSNPQDGFRAFDKDSGGNLDMEELTAAVEEYARHKAELQARQARRKKLLQAAETQAKERAAMVYQKDWVHFLTSSPVTSPLLKTITGKSVQKKAAFVPPVTKTDKMKREVALATFSSPAEIPLEMPALDIRKMASDYVQQYCAGGPSGLRELERQALYHVPVSKRPGG